MNTQILIIGLFIAFGIGYSVGSGRPDVVNPWPVNYNPQAQMQNDAIKLANEATERCWKLTLQKLQQDKGVGH